MTETTEKSYQVLTPHQAAASDKTLYVRNTTKTIITHSDPNGGRLKLGPVWSDESLGILPSNVAQNGDFQKLIRSGAVVVTDDPSIEDELTERNERIERRDQEKIDSIAVELEPAPGQNDLVPTKVTNKGVGREFESNGDEGGVQSAVYNPETGKTEFAQTTVSIEPTQKG